MWSIPIMHNSFISEELRVILPLLHTFGITDGKEVFNAITVTWFSGHD
jgi:hypothetical protein